MAENLTACPGEDIRDLRRRNLATVEAYLSLKGPDHIDERLALFTEDGMQEICSTKSCLPERTVGREALRARMLRVKRNWADFSYSNIKIYQAESPETFIVECNGQGLIQSPVFTRPHPYESLYILIFSMHHGKIKALREFSNPLKLYHSYWGIMPDNIR